MKTIIHIVALVLLIAAPSFAQEAERVDFARQILPILSNKCFVCHGPDAKDEDLVRLDSFAGATVDLGEYRAVDNLHPEKSELLSRIDSVDDPMPPAEFDKKLTAQERALLRRWVNSGGQYSKHWAFVPPVKNDVGKIAADENPIDHWVGAQLQENGIDFAPSASKSVLARRAALVLTGLPPEAGLLDAFLADKSDRAYPRLVDELLADPRFGEHQARYWLDAVRYGDTHGLHLDNRRGIYPYRDWVVKAFNENLPFDDFITWQLAGDLLPAPTLAQQVATGFVRMNPTTGEGGAIPLEFQAKNNFDRVETFGTVFLGMSLNCARCHTHKYDPIKQREYYQLLAFFNSTAEPSMDRNAYEYGTVARAPQDQDAWANWQLLELAQTTLLADTEKQLEASGLDRDAIAKWKNGSADEKLKLLAGASEPWVGLDGNANANLIQSRKSVATKKFTTTLIAKDLEKPRKTHVLKRGEYDLPIGAPVQPGVIEIMSELPEGAPRNRLGLAQWLTARSHPLTSRVMVNQVWQRVFGVGLVRTPEDFGVQGRQSSHPQLLDWLAVEFQERGWDHKQLIRTMVTSRTFCQSSARREKLADSENLLYARGPSFRLDAEVLRDIGLWASGLLDPTMGGEGVKPYQPPGMWLAMAHPGSNTKNYVADKGPRLYRRSLYVYWKRTSPHPMMTLFDAPSREASCVRRSTTNTSLQALALLNETQRIEMARTLAAKLMTEFDEDSQRLDRLFQILACRPPTEVERNACDQLLSSMLDRFGKDKKAAASLLSYGDAPGNKKLDVVVQAAWTQVAATVLASDVAILLY